MWMLRLDRCVLRVYTRVAHAVQRWTGKMSYGLVRIACGVAALAAMLHELNYWLPHLLSTPTKVFEAPMWVIAMLAVARMTHVSRELEDEFMRDPSVIPYSTWTRSSSSVVRGFMFILSLIVGPMVIHDVIARRWLDMGANLYAFAQISIFYLIEVPPLPPGESKIRQFLNTLRPMPRLIHAKERG